jgi:hypothetical protein
LPDLVARGITVFFPIRAGGYAVPASRAEVETTPTWGNRAISSSGLGYYV